MLLAAAVVEEEVEGDEDDLSVEVGVGGKSLTSIFPNIPYSSPVVSDPNPKSVKEKLNNCVVSIKSVFSNWKQEGLVYVQHKKSQKRTLTNGLICWCKWHICCR